MGDELTIGELSARSGVAASALRFYEAQGLIESRRTGGNQRRYDRATLRRIAFVQAGRAAGIPLADVAAALAGLPVRAQADERGLGAALARLEQDLDARIETLEALRDRLTTCIGCGCLSIDRCELLNPDDEASALGGGAHYLTRDGARSGA